MGKVVSIDVEVAFDVVLVHASQREVGEHYVQLSQERYVREAQCRSVWLIDRDANAHPRNIAYQAPAAARAVAHAVEHPGCIVGAFAALALHGLPFLVDAADTTLYCTTDRTKLGNEISPTVLRMPRPLGKVCTLRHRGVAFRAFAPAEALVQALQHIRKGMHRWNVVHIDGLEPVDVMAIQLIDSCRRFLEVRPEQIKEAAARRLSRRWLERVLLLSSALADSPKETELRLLLSSVVRKYGYTLQEQVPLYYDGVIVTTFDFAIPALKIGAMYDGAHHWEYAQRQKDAAINLKATRLGWTVPRCSSTTMFELVDLICDLIRQKAADVGAF